MIDGRWKWGGMLRYIWFCPMPISVGKKMARKKMVNRNGRMQNIIFFILLPPLMYLMAALAKA